MNRRNFIRQSGNATFFAAMMSSTVAGFEPQESDSELVEIFTAQNDLLIDSILVKQQLDESRPFHGGFPNEYMIFHVGTCAWYINRMMCGFVWPGSRYFQDKEVAEAIAIAMKFVKGQQHDDGTIDLTTTNFHSPPDTGFVVEPISLSVNLARRHAGNQLVQFRRTAESFLEKAGNALSIGGIHTPNHRWVVCMALAWINHLVPNKSLVLRIDQWLDEGIDIDSEGHFNERSTSVYSPLTDRCLITIARLLKRPELLEPVRKNLQLTSFLVHPNGEIVTEVSRRQDQFRIAKMGNYYYPYRYMSIGDSDRLFASMARMIEKTVGKENLSGNLTYLLDDQEVNKPLPEGSPLPVNYTKEFSKSRIIRLRRNRIDSTILADNETFATIHHGNAVLRAIRMATAFFGKGQFKSPSIENLAGRYRLSQSLTGPYFQPLSKDLLAGNTDWNRMPKHRRRQTEVQKLEAHVSIEEADGVLSFTFSIAGTDRVPIAIELAFAKGGTLHGCNAAPMVPNAYLVEADGFSFTQGGDTISVNGARSNHGWTQLRGALPKLDAKSVYITDFTPFQFVMKVS